jgi:ribosomal protein S18 acetylase RimI-like enzyme
MTAAIVFRRNHAGVNDIAGHLAACDTDFMPPLSQRVCIENYAAKLAQLAELFEAWSSEELAGLVAAYFNQPEKQTAFISNVSMLPHWRGAGISDQLLESCFCHARACAFAQVELRLASANKAALHLYERHGFRQSGIDGEDIILRRDLSPPGSKIERHGHDTQL